MRDEGRAARPCKMGGTGSKQEDQIITVARREDRPAARVHLRPLQGRRRRRGAAGRQARRFDRQQPDRGGRAMARRQAAAALRVRPNRRPKVTCRRPRPRTQLAAAPLRDRLDRVVDGRIDVIADELHRDFAAALIGDVGEVGAALFWMATVMIWSSCFEPVPPIFIELAARPSRASRYSLAACRACRH